MHTMMWCHQKGFPYAIALEWCLLDVHCPLHYLLITTKPHGFCECLRSG